MATRVERIATEIVKVADAFVTDSSVYDGSLWQKWEAKQKKLALDSFSRFQVLCTEHLTDPDLINLLFDNSIWTPELAERADPSTEAREKFYETALPYMIREAGAREIQWEIEQKNDLPINAQKNADFNFQWELLKQDDDLSKRAWIFIGKFLTHKYFDELNAANTRGRGRPKMAINNSEILITSSLIALKRYLYKPLYELTPFEDKEIVEALLSDSNNEKLELVLKVIGLSNSISLKSVCNIISAGRQKLPLIALMEDPVQHHVTDENNAREFYINDGVCSDEQIHIAERRLGSLTGGDKKAIRLNFKCPTEVTQALSVNDLREADLETILNWRLMPDQIQEVVNVAKSKFGLTYFKNEYAQNISRDYW